MTNHTPRYCCIDLFAGIGGIRAGFERAAGEGMLDTVFVSEIDRYAATTYAANYSTPTNLIDGISDLLVNTAGVAIYGDITKVSDNALSQIPQFDICLAGFPCQAFSQAGKRMGFEDNYKGMARGTLFRELIRVCDINKPKVVFCENVKGLLHHDNGNTLQVILGAFDEAGYAVDFTTLNSSDFGVPQNRERIYLVAFRKELGITSFSFPEGEKTSLRIGDILEKQPVGGKYYLSQQYLNTLKRHRAKHEKQGHGFGYQIKKGDDLASTLSCGGMGRERNLVVDSRPHPTGIVAGKHSPINTESVRCMTPREWARLQGFDEDFVLPVADVHLYKQFGNTVTVNVIEAIARRVLDALDAVYRSREFNVVLNNAIIDCLKKAPMSRQDIFLAVDHLFPSSWSREKRLEKLSSNLHALKSNGIINSRGKTKSAVWFLVDPLNHAA